MNGAGFVLISVAHWHYIDAMSNEHDDNLFAEDADSLIDSMSQMYDLNQEHLDAIHILENEVDRVRDSVGIYITLFDLYSQLENMQEAGQCLVEASRGVDREKHRALIYFLYNQLELFAQLSPQAQAAYERMGDLIAGDDDINPSSVALDQRRLNMQDFIPELLLAQHLTRSKKLSPSEFQIVVEDLCWFGAQPQTAPRACLYVFHDRQLPHEDRAIEFLAQDAAMPYIDLNLIEPEPDFLEVLPPESCLRRAACVFGQVGGEPMVALLNPFNLKLMDDISRRLECEPHFFLTRASGYTHFLEIQRAVAGDESSR